MSMSPGLKTSPSEWMTITDDSLSNELERELAHVSSGDVLMAGVDDLVSGRAHQRFHGRLWEDRPGIRSRAGGPVDAYRVQAEIDTETAMGIAVRSRSVLTPSDLF